jgi:hypothetical protein
MTNNPLGGYILWDTGDMCMPEFDQGYHGDVYQIKIIGNLDQKWSGWFNNLEIILERANDNAEITTLTGQITDQAKLRGILNKIWDLNLHVISVNQLLLRK